MTKSRFTRIGTLRAGIEYQDIIALRVLIDWLEHSNRYEWVRVEADDAGYLDDIVALRTDGSLLAHQVKFSTNPDVIEDYWRWSDLLKRRKETQESLLQKWASSLDKPLLRQYPIYEASVVSNRQPAPDVKQALSATGFIDFDQIVDENILEEIILQLQSEQNARGFFAQFQFRFNEPNLEELEKGLRRRFHENLGGTEIGWKNLKEELSVWVRERKRPEPDGLIHLGHIRRAALWYQLQSLPQKFEIPPDYVLPSDQFHEELVNHLLSLKQGCLVLTGSPGVGKSTYCSYLYQHLKDNGVPIIRHHYFLSLKDRTIQERTEHQRAAASLMHELERDHSEALGDLASQNPVPSNLSEWIAACGDYYGKQDKALIVIIDGLDHVWRERRSVEELDTLLGHILPTPNNVVVLLATQPVADSQLPVSLPRYTPRNQWRKLPLLNEQAVRKWLHHHEKDITYDSNNPIPEHVFERISNAFYRKSKGHPLHLCYSLRTLQERNITVTEDSVNSLPECPHEDINAYYRNLWHVLPEEGREILHLFAICPFPWPRRDDVVKCIDPQGLRTGDILKNFRQVEHLLIPDRMGFGPFHSSLPAFIATLEEHSDYAYTHKQRALHWLQTEAPEYWRWAYEWIFAADLGDSQLLREGPSRQWAIESIVRHCPRHEVENILSRSIQTALEVKNLPRAIELGLFKDYFYPLFEFENENRELLLYPQLVLEDDLYLRARLQSNLANLSNNEVYLLAEAEFNRDNFEAVRLCLVELSDRFHLNPSRETITPLLKVAAIAQDYDPTRIVDLTIRNRETGHALEILSVYSRYLRIHRETERLRQLLTTKGNSINETETLTEFDNQELNEVERAVVLRHAILLALEEGLNFDDLLSDPRNYSNPYTAIYIALRKVEGVNPNELTFPDTEVLSDQHYIPYEQQQELSDWFYWVFFCLLANYLHKKEIHNGEWLRNIGTYTWQRRLIQKLGEIALTLSDQLLAGQTVSFGWFYEKIGEFTRPDMSSARQDSIWRYRNAIADAALEIGFDLLVLTHANGGNYAISKVDLETAFTSDYCHPNAWMHLYVTRRRLLLDDRAVEWFLRKMSREVSSSIEPFNERTETFCILASIAALHQLYHQARSFTYSAASDFFAHGHHKDLLINEVVEIIQLCHRSGSYPSTSAGDDLLLKNLIKLAPAIAHIEDFTDSDETGHLPRLLAEALAEIKPELLPIYYQWLFSIEEYYDAQHAFRVFLKSADLSSLINQAIAATAVSDHSVDILVERAENGDKDAERILSTQLDFLGKNATYRPPNSSEATNTYGSDLTISEKQASSVAEYPPARFDDFVADLSNQSIWERNQYISQWIEFWAATKHKSAVLKVVEPLLERGHELRDYDTIFELAFAIYGKNRAYPYLVRAHYTDHGWSHYFTSKEKAANRWQIVKQHYRDRWFDFIKDTATYEEPSIDRLSILRIVEYCLLMDQPQLAMSIMEKVVDTALDFVSPIVFPQPGWIPTKGNQPDTHSSLVMLFTQLAWPSGLVRERACTAIANLLDNSQCSDIVLTYLLRWIAQQKLESMVTIGLLVLLRAQMLSSRFSLPPIEQINEAIKKPSLLSWQLLSVLYPNANLPIDDVLIHSETPPGDFTPDSFFEKYATNFLPPIYYEFWITEIEQRTRLPVRLQCAYEWQCIIDETGTELSRNPLDFWQNRQEGKEHHVSVDTKMSEVYRSAYLRALAWTVTQKRMTQRDASFLAAQACPIDLELWQLNPTARPEWWPYVPAKTDTEEIDTTIAELWKRIEQLWEQQWEESQKRFNEDWILAEASGIVHRSSEIYDLEIYGLFQKCHGPVLPSNEEIVYWYQGMSDQDRNVIATSCPSHLHFSGILEKQSLDERVQVFDDWSVAPAAGIVRINGTTPRWQFWRMYRNIWLPSPFLSDSEITFGHESEGLVAKSNNKIIGKWNDWTDALGEKMFDNIPPATGQQLFLSRKVVEQFTVETTSHFCWICRLTYYYRENTYSSYKEFTDYRVFGATSIVVP
jgi:hypothetical protein